MQKFSGLRVPGNTIYFLPEITIHSGCQIHKMSNLHMGNHFSYHYFHWLEFESPCSHVLSSNPVILIFIFFYLHMVSQYFYELYFLMLYIRHSHKIMSTRIHRSVLWLFPFFKLQRWLQMNYWEQLLFCRRKSILISAQKLCLQAYLKDIAGSISDHHNKVNISVKRVTGIFGFPVHIKVIFTLYCSLLSVQKHYVWKYYIPY